MVRAHMFQTKCSLSGLGPRLRKSAVCVYVRVAQRNIAARWRVRVREGKGCRAEEYGSAALRRASQLAELREVMAGYTDDDLHAHSAAWQKGSRVSRVLRL